jgi:hypothetical protein
MNYKTLRLIVRNKNRFLMPFNSADGTTTDGSTDANITRDPNNYLAPRADGLRIADMIILIAAVLTIVTSLIVLIPYAKKQLQ